MPQLSSLVDHANIQITVLVRCTGNPGCWANAWVATSCLASLRLDISEREGPGAICQANRMPQSCARIQSANMQITVLVRCTGNPGCWANTWVATSCLASLRLDISERE